MKLIHILTAVALLFALPGFQSSRVSAQGTNSPEALAAAKELFSILSKDMLNQLVRETTAHLWPVVDRDLASKNIDVNTRATLRKEFERIQSDNMQSVLQDAPAIYARFFTASELKELTTFYQTPIGQKALKILPQAMGELMQTMMPKMQRLMSQTKQSFERVLREKGYVQ